MATLQNYYGRYDGPGGDFFLMTVQRGHLVFQYSGDALLSYTLYPSAANRFYPTIVEATATFRTNATGLATNLVWFQGGTSTTYQKVPLPALLAIAKNGDQVGLTLQGDTGVEYVIEVSPDLRDWSPLSTNTIWNNVIVDSAAPTAARRFYRAVAR